MDTVKQIFILEKILLGREFLAFQKSEEVYITIGYQVLKIDGEFVVINVIKHEYFFNGFMYSFCDTGLKTHYVRLIEYDVRNQIFKYCGFHPNLYFVITGFEMNVLKINGDIYPYDELR